MFSILCDRGIFYSVGFPVPAIEWALPLREPYFSVHETIYNKSTIPFTQIKEPLPLWKFIGQKEFYQSISLVRTITGVLFNIIIWFLISTIIVSIFELQRFVIKVPVKQLLATSIGATLVVGLIIPVSIDGADSLLTRGLPFPFLPISLADTLEQLPLSLVNFNLFMFTLDVIVAACLIIVLLSGIHVSKKFAS